MQTLSIHTAITYGRDCRPKDTTWALAKADFDQPLLQTTRATTFGSATWCAEMKYAAQTLESGKHRSRPQRAADHTAMTRRLSPAAAAVIAAGASAVRKRRWPSQC